MEEILLTKLKFFNFSLFFSPSYPLLPPLSPSLLSFFLPGKKPLPSICLAESEIIVGAARGCNRTPPSLLSRHQIFVRVAVLAMLDLLLCSNHDNSSLEALLQVFWLRPQPPSRRRHMPPPLSLSTSMPIVSDLLWSMVSDIRSAQRVCVEEEIHSFDLWFDDRHEEILFQLYNFLNLFLHYF